MADDITNKVLLEHMQGIKNDLPQQMKNMKQDTQKQISNLIERMDRGFKEAKEHREALQEDLTATMQDTINIRRHVGMPIASE